MSQPRVNLILVLLITLFVMTGLLAVASSNGYNIDRWTLNNGGGTSAAGQYYLVGTVGQPDADTAMTGGTYRLTGGYWGAVGNYKIFLPLILR